MPAAQFVNWVFTLNNPTAQEEALLNSLVPNVAVYVVFQREKGEVQGTEHFQGYIELKAKKTLHAMRSLLERAHLEPRKGTQQQAIDYSKKEDTRIDGPWEFGTPKAQPQVHSYTSICGPQYLTYWVVPSTFCDTDWNDAKINHG